MFPVFCKMELALGKPQVATCNFKLTQRRTQSRRGNAKLRKRNRNTDTEIYKPQPWIPKTNTEICLSNGETVRTKRRSKKFKRKDTMRKPDILSRDLESKISWLIHKAYILTMKPHVWRCKSESERRMRQYRNQKIESFLWQMRIRKAESIK